jgi:membrane fusion protein, type I secretion system
MHNPNQNPENPGASETHSIRRLTTIGIVSGMVLIGGVGGWTALTEISGAVVAQGHVKVESNAKLVQHAQGGIVGDIRKHEGDLVKKGEVLIVLDAAEIQARTAMVRGRLAELILRRERLLAERDNKPDIDISNELKLLLGQEPAAKSYLRVQRKLLTSRQSSKASKLMQIKQRSSQLRKEVREFANQEASKKREIQLLREDLARYEKLRRKRLVRRTKVSDAQRQLSRAQGDLSRLSASKARARNELAQMSTKTEEVSSGNLSEVLKELNQVNAEIAQLQEQKRAAQDRMARLEIRAPAAGRIHEMSVHTKGGVINAGATIMQIIPGNEGLVVEARSAPHDIDQVEQGMPAHIRFTAFSARSTPELKGIAETVSADRSVDPSTGQAYYKVIVRVDKSELGKLNGQKLMPGMPAEVLLITEPRTVLSYLAKPIVDQFRLAFRED